MTVNRLTAKLFVISFAFTILSASAQAQVLPKNRTPAAKGGAPAAPAAGQPVAPQPAIPEAGEAPGQTRREGRQEARDARADARAAGETGPQARETARETRQGTRQNIQATRGADYGLWFGNQTNNGLIVNDIANNSVFSNVGLREGDRIVSINGQPVTSESQFVQYLNSPTLGTQPVQLAVLRNGQQTMLTLQPNMLTQGVVNHDPLYQYGLVLDNRNPNQIMVQQVYPRTPAYYAGIRQGDVITTLGGQNLANVNAFTQGLSQANGNLALGVTRAGQTRNLEMQALQAGDSTARTALRPNLDAAASGSLNASGAPVGAQGGATINTQGGATINPPANSTTPPPAAQPSPQAAPPASNNPTPAPRPNTGAGASGAAGANLPGASVSGTAGANAGATGAGVSGTAGATGSAGVNTPATGTTPNTGASGTAGPSGSTSPTQPK